MNRQVLDEVGISEKDFLKWCKKYHKPKYKPEIKREFFAKIQEGKIVKVNGEVEEK